MTKMCMSDIKQSILYISSYNVPITILKDRYYHSHLGDENEPEAK